MMISAVVVSLLAFILGAIGPAAAAGAGAGAPRCHAASPALQSKTMLEKLQSGKYVYRAVDGTCVFHAYSHTEAMDVLKGSWTIVFGGSNAGVMFVRMLGFLSSTDDDSATPRSRSGYPIYRSRPNDQYPLMWGAIEGLSTKSNQSFDVLDSFWNDDNNLIKINTAVLYNDNLGWAGVNISRDLKQPIKYTTRITRFHGKSWYSIMQFLKALMVHRAAQPSPMKINIVVGPSIGRWYGFCCQIGLCSSFTKKDFPALAKRIKAGHKPDFKGMQKDYSSDLAEFSALLQTDDYQRLVSRTVLLYFRDKESSIAWSADATLLSAVRRAPNTVVVYYNDSFDNFAYHMSGLSSFLNFNAAFNMIAPFSTDVEINLSPVSVFGFSARCYGAEMLRLTIQGMVNVSSKYQGTINDMYDGMYMSCAVTALRSYSEMQLTSSTVDISSYATMPFGSLLVAVAAIGILLVLAYQFRVKFVKKEQKGSSGGSSGSSSSSNGGGKEESGTRAPPSAQHITTLNFCRYIASIHIVAGHLYNKGYSLIPNQLNHPIFATLRRILPWGYTWVPFFFTLSGFVLTLAAQKRNTDWETKVISNESRLSFVWKRLHSVYPLYLIGLLVAYGLQYYQSSSSFASSASLLVELLLMQAWFPALVESVLQPHCWFLSCQVLYWFFFDDFMRYIMRLTQKQVIQYLAVCAIVIPWVVSVVIPMAYGLPTNWYVNFHSQAQLSSWTDILVICLKFHPFCYIHVFLSGMLVARLHYMMAHSTHQYVSTASRDDEQDMDKDKDMGMGMGTDTDTVSSQRTTIRPSDTNVTVFEYVMRNGASIGYVGLYCVFIFPSLRPFGAKLSCRLGVLSPLHCLILFGLANGSDVLCSPFSFWVCRLLGEWSYAQYIFQFIVFNVFISFVSISPAGGGGLMIRVLDIALFLVCLLSASALGATFIQTRGAKYFYLFPKVLFPLSVVWFVFSALQLTAPGDFSTHTHTRDIPLYVSLPLASHDLKLNLTLAPFPLSEKYHIINPSIVKYQGQYIVAARLHYLETLLIQADGLHNEYISREYRYHSAIVMGTLSLDFNMLEPMKLVPTPTVVATDATGYTTVNTALDPLRHAPCRRPAVFFPHNNSYVSTFTTGPEDPRLMVLHDTLYMSYFAYKPVHVPGEVCATAPSEEPIGWPYMIGYDISTVHARQGIDNSGSGSGRGRSRQLRATELVLDEKLLLGEVQVVASHISIPLASVIASSKITSIMNTSKLISAHSKVQKNWVMFKKDHVSYVIYSLYPFHRVFSLSSKYFSSLGTGTGKHQHHFYDQVPLIQPIVDKYCAEEDDVKDELCLHGSVNPILLADIKFGGVGNHAIFLGIFHVVAHGGVYKHFFYTFSSQAPAFKILNVSSEIGLQSSSGVAFVSSVLEARHAGEPHLVLTYGSDDVEARILVMSRAHLMDLFSNGTSSSTSTSSSTGRL
jgi:peptidoglycan/LPS O-acetylase OafA/YrhL